jgi:hypothetical protein
VGFEARLCLLKESNQSFPTFFSPEERVEQEVGGNWGEVCGPGSFEPRAMLYDMGNRLQVDTMLRAVGSLARVKTRCIVPMNT